MAKTKKPGYNPGFQSPYIPPVSQTPNAPGGVYRPPFTPSAGGSLPTSPQSKTVKDTSVSPTAKPAPAEDFNPVALIKTTRTKGQLPEQVQLQQEQKNKVEIARILAEGGHAGINPSLKGDLSALEQQQTQEQQQTAGMIDVGPQATEMQRLVMSGLIVPVTLQNFGEIIRSKITGQPVRKLYTTEELAQTGVGKAMGTVIGEGLKFTDLNIPFTNKSINDVLFGDYEKTIEHLKADAANLEGTSKIVLTGVRDGRSATLAIQRMKKIEEATRQRYADAMKINKDNPDSIREGLNLTDDLVAALTTIQERRFIIERYKITHDPTEIISEAQTFVSQ